MPRRAFRVAALGAALNALAPLALATQLAILGRSSAAQGGFGSVVVVAGAFSSALNFLVDGSCAQVGAFLGARDASRAAAAARMTVVCALCVGGAAGGAALAVRARVLAAFGAAGVRDAAKAYATYRFLAIPCAMCWSSALGIVSGCGRVGVAAAAAAAAAVGETVVVATANALGGDSADVLRRAGVGFVLVSALEAVGALVMISRVVPKGESAPLRVWSAPALDAARAVGFARDGASMAVRSALLQGTFVLATLIAANHFDAAGLAAHHIVVTLWMLCSYVVDGFATSANVLGSRLFGNGERDELIRLSHNLLACGVITGFVFSALLVGGKSAIPNVFTRDVATKETLLNSGVWNVLVLAQPVNAACFVYDGFAYATHSFAYVREMMATGVGLVFLPVLYLANRPNVSLKGIWQAKLALNVWRVAWLAVRVHVWLPRQNLERREVGDGRASSDDGDDEGESYREPLLPDAEDSDEDVEAPAATPGGVQYESSLKPSKIKAKNRAAIQTPELAVARASNSSR